MARKIKKSTATGEIANYELIIPFAYLHQIAEGQKPRNTISSGSDQIRLGADAK